MPVALLRTNSIAATSFPAPSSTPTRNDPAPVASPELSAHSQVWQRWPLGALATNSFHRRRSEISVARRALDDVPAGVIDAVMAAVVAHREVRLSFSTECPQG